MKFYRFKLLFHLLPQLLIGFALYALGDLALHFDAFTRLIALVFLTPAIVFLTILSLVLGIQTNETNPLSPEHVIVSKQGIIVHALEHDLPGWGMLVHGPAGGHLLLAPFHPGQPIPYGEISCLVPRLSD